MNNEIKELKLNNGKSIMVEMISSEREIDISSSSQTYDLPDGAEQVSVIDNTKDAISILKDNITNVSDIVYDSLKDNMPDEWTVEMNIGFKGKTSPIPYIVSAEMNGGIKIKATWKKD